MLPAFSTMPRRFLWAMKHIQIGSAQKMPMLTVGFPSVFSHDARTAQYIFLMSYRLQVFRSDAKPRSTQMIQRQSRRDCSNRQQKSDTVSRCCRTLEMNKAVPVRVSVPSPQPAGLGFFDLCPETALKGAFGEWNKSPCRTLALPVQTAPPTSESWPTAIGNRTDRIGGHREPTLSDVWGRTLNTLRPCLLDVPILPKAAI